MGSMNATGWIKRVCACALGAIIVAVSIAAHRGMAQCPFTREGYEFAGWNEEPDGLGASCQSGEQVVLDDDLTLHAQRSKKSYDVTFVTNGGSHIDSQVVAYGERAEEPAKPTKGGYTFAGWYHDGLFSRAYDFGMPVTGDLVLYARWERTKVAEVRITLKPASYTYDGQPKRPTPTVVMGERELTAGIDYVVAYKHNTNAGMARVTIRGVGVYTGSASAGFLIHPTTFCVTPPKAQTFAGRAVLAMPTVTSGSRTLRLGPDYTLAWSHNTQPGIATITVKGKGNYTGEQTVTFPILEKDEAADNDGMSVR